MKCEVCLELLEEYSDGELAELEAREVAGHLMTCVSCANQSAVFMAEQEMFSRYDRELEVPAALWGKIAEQTTAPVVKPAANNGFAFWLVGLFRVPSFGFSVATAVALIVIAILIGTVYVRTWKATDSKKVAKQSPLEPKVAPEKTLPDRVDVPRQIEPVVAHITTPKPPRVSRAKHSEIDQSDVLSSDTGYQDMEDEDTAKHLEQTQNLLRSIRNVSVTDGDKDIDVSYDKALSRRLLNENIVLRSDAEMKGKVPAKALLSDLEPFLLDIANLPDQARPDDVRAIKERVQKTEIVAALIGY